MRTGVLARLAIGLTAWFLGRDLLASGVLDDPVWARDVPAAAGN
jgi:hypothetical protein